MKKLKKIKSSQVHVFKIKNRRGFASIYMDHLTEGASQSQVLERMKKALCRSGYELK